MQIVFKGSDYMEAHIVANLLEHEGISAFVGGHFLQGALGEIGVSNLVDVRVSAEDVEQAFALIMLYDKDQLANKNTAID